MIKITQCINQRFKKYSKFKRNDFELSVNAFQYLIYKLFSWMTMNDERPYRRFISQRQSI